MNDILCPTIQNPLLTTADYQQLYARSLKDPVNFWSEQAEKFVTWFKRWDKVLTGDFKQLNVQWFTQGKLNAAYNCLDRHLEKRKNQIAIYWEGNSPEENRTFTYAELYETVCRFSNVLKKQGIKKGDRVGIYLPMVPEAIIAMLASARIGAVHSVIFAGFSPQALKTRLIDAECKLLITANESLRGTQTTPLKQNVDKIIADCPQIKQIIVVQRTPSHTPWDPKKNSWYHELMDAQKNAHCPCEMIDAADPFYILYTSGSTGKPKGILHTLGGHLVYVAMTFKYVFNYTEDDIYWCTADIGWVTGHSYLVYGPLLHGASIVLFEGLYNYPTPARFWEIVDKYHVNIFYTSPTALRALRREGDDWVKHSHRNSLKCLGSVGEPINPDVWEWYYSVVGNKKCPIVDTWWQTETGGILISPFPSATPLKPGSAGWPFFGIVPAILDANAKECAEDQLGKLVIKEPWPGIMHSIYGDRSRFQDTYFSDFPGFYYTGDNAKKDKDGYFWITGREDDVIKIAGHRIGSGELESAFLTHAAVSEVGVVPVKDDIKGDAIYAFVVLKKKRKGSEKLKKELIQTVRQEIGAIATPKIIQWANNLPKTRSGKIMRRILRKIANQEFEDLGDTQTLAEPEVVDALIKQAKLNDR